MMRKIKKGNVTNIPNALNIVCYENNKIGRSRIMSAILSAIYKI